MRRYQIYLLDIRQQEADMAKTLFFVAGFGLVLSGVLHLSFLFSTPLDPNAMVPVVLIGLLALAYLVIGVLLLMRRETALMAGIVAPVIGVVLVLALAASSTLLIGFIALDVIAAACCAYLYGQSRATIRRLR
jgi:hypothetical protein